MPLRPLNREQVWMLPPTLGELLPLCSYIYYYLVTEPAYAALIPNTKETVVREGRIIAEKPRIVTPLIFVLPGRVQ
jgi:hypothetical protein